MPNIYNKTPLPAQMVPLIDRDGRNVAVIIIKATFDIEPSGQLRLSKHQAPVLFVDEPAGRDPPQPPRVPADLTDFKPAGDLVIVAPPTAEARDALNGRRISLTVGSVQFSKKVKDKWPFGPLRRDEQPRRSFAGTYDDAWIKQRMPLLPVDFDPRHNLTAPPDQIVAGYLSGDERVVIGKLYDHGDLSVSLPGRAIVVSGNVLHRYFTEVATLDTLLVWAEAPRLTLVWRCTVRPRQKIEEVSNVNISLARLKNVRELYGTA
jgi:hypothetical protein